MMIISGRRAVCISFRERTNEEYPVYSASRETPLQDIQDTGS